MALIGSETAAPLAAVPIADAMLEVASELIPPGLPLDEQAYRSLVDPQPSIPRGPRKEIGDTLCIATWADNTIAFARTPEGAVDMPQLAEVDLKAR
jgi:hypothetical protein